MYPMGYIKSRKILQPVTRARVRAVTQRSGFECCYRYASRANRISAGLAPKGCFISTEAIEREVGQISETQKATRKVSSGIDAGSTEFGPEPGTTSVLFVIPCDVGSKLTGPVRPNSA